ncbi:GNAT family N-acetyltransferase [Croceivirga thetidis]|uniref:GNAT family N-acetyltransferase n=1 Tax=Croceivirga thetidis TaxID=2721623 RepID=A0ABX1GSI0_9FLAO|nr:GNAT family N-acetyltransferase [Croceivirga thetidis]NKI32579.1 GNAT family N-acetyltransferase [Croceivirga thetidis]
MVNLNGQKIFLRALEPADLDFLYKIENDTAIWEISGTQKPYSKSTLKKYLKNAHLDIYEIKQLRLCICKKTGESVGFIDLFDFDPNNKRVGVGLIVADEEHRNKGFGKEALGLICEFALGHLDVHQVYANILEENKASIHLFESEGFARVGTKKDWIRAGSGFKNEILYQKIKK